MAKRIAILGAGNGGCTFAAHLALKGFDVRLYEDPQFKTNVDEINERDGIDVSGQVEGFGEISRASTDMAETVPGADIVMVVVPAFAQMTMIEKALPYLEDGQVIVFNPDNFATLLLRRILVERGLKRNIKMAGTASLLYACRRVAPATVNIFYEKDAMPVAAFPASDTDAVVRSLRDLFPQFKPGHSVLEVGMGNINQVLHCPAAVLNAGWIEHSKGGFMFYWEGMTESVCRVMERVDDEKVQVADKLGFRLPSAHEYLKDYYRSEKPGIDLHDFVTHSRAHGGRGPDAPASLEHRYISEDVPNGLVPVSLLGDLVGVPTPSMDAVITLASTLNRVDYVAKGRTLEQLGLSGKSTHEVMDLIMMG